MTITDKAARKIKTLFASRSDIYLRVEAIEEGLEIQYGLKVVEKPGFADIVFESNEIKLVVGPTSILHLEDSVLDYINEEDTLFGGGFRIK